MSGSRSSDRTKNRSKSEVKGFKDKLDSLSGSKCQAADNFNNSYLLVSGEKRGRCELNLLYVEIESNHRHSQYSLAVEALNFIVESKSRKSLPAEVNDLNIE